MNLIKEIDYGTPQSSSDKMVKLTIDGQSVTVPEGTSIIRAAMEIGTEIPKLCATDSIKAFGSCRLCLVEIDGRGGTPAPAVSGTGAVRLSTVDFSWSGAVRAPAVSGEVRR